MRPHKGTEILAGIKEPYFDRTYGRYCSHLNTPNRPVSAGHPGGIRKGNVVFLPHELGEMYYLHGARIHRDLFTNALRLVYKNPVLKTDMPSAGRINMLHQPDRNRYVVHLLYAPPLQRGRCLVIEDMVPLHDIPVELRVPEKVKKAYTVPNENRLIPELSGDKTKVTIPTLQCHCTVVLEY